MKYALSFSPGDHYRSLFGKYAGWAQSVIVWLFFFYIIIYEHEYMKHIFGLQVTDQIEERLSQLFTQLKLKLSST